MKPNPVVHFEVGYEDKERMCSFYEGVFGWKLTRMGPEMGNYVLAESSETDEQTMRPKEAGRINGGFYRGRPTTRSRTRRHS